MTRGNEGEAVQSHLDSLTLLCNYFDAVQNLNFEQHRCNIGCCKRQRIFVS